MTKSIKELNIELIENNLDLSGNKLYQLSKNKGIGIRKTDFLKLVREVKNKPEPTKLKQVQSTPTKYRIKQIDVIKKPDKEGLYGIVEIKTTDKNGKDTSFWIKYKDNKDKNRQIRALQNPTNDDTSDLSNDYHEVFHGFKKKKSFIAKEFKEFLLQDKIKV